MATPSYSNLITQVVTRLKQDRRLTAVKDRNIYTGSNIPQVSDWPAITVTLDRVDEEWRTFAGRSGGNKTAICTIRLTVLDRVATGQSGYLNGLSSVEGIVKTIDDIIQSDMSISGVAYQSETVTKTFSQGNYNNTPVLGAEVELITKLGFARSS